MRIPIEHIHQNLRHRGGVGLITPIADPVETFTESCMMTSGGQRCSTIRSLDNYLSQLLITLENSAGAYVGAFGSYGNLDADLAAFRARAKSWCEGVASGSAACDMASAYALADRYRDQFINWLKANTPWEFFGTSTIRYAVDPGITFYEYATGQAKPHPGAPTQTPEALQSPGATPPVWTQTPTPPVQTTPVYTAQGYTAPVYAAPPTITTPGISPQILTMGAPVPSTTQNQTAQNQTAAPPNWFNEQMITGVPNWALAAGGAVLLLIVVMGNK